MLVYYKTCQFLINGKLKSDLIFICGRALLFLIYVWRIVPLMHFSLLNNYTITPHVFVKTAAPERSSVGFHWAGGGGACGGSSLQEYNKIQLLLLLLAATQLYSFVLSIGVHSTSCQVLTSAASTVKKMLLDMTLLQSKFFTFLAFKGGKK